jgi:two-component system sensor histidine kinase BarA
MKKHKRRSIGRKITFVVLIAVMASVVTATGYFLWRQTADALESRERQLTATANVFASVISEHVKSDNRNGVLRALRAIGKMPSIPFAVVSRKNGSTLAVLGSAIILRGKSPPKPQTMDKSKGKNAGHSVLSLLNSTSLPISVKVINGGEEVGALLLLADVSDLRKSLLQGFAVALLAVFVASLLGMLIAARMKQSITRPIKNLMEAMLEVQATNNFDMQVVRESNDETGQLVESFNDMLFQISERDQKLSDHRASLEKTVENRTKELLVAKDVAEQANMAKSDFLATMSHEIRTPMNGVMVMAELLAGGNLLPRQQRYAEVIVRSGQSLLTIINDILDLSKIEAGKLELERVPVSPAAIIDDVISLFWQKASSKNVDIASFVGVDVPSEIVGDPVRLNQILSNLVNNALKFTETGYVAISVKTVPMSDAGIGLEFSVTDTGIGIAADKLSSVFQEFTQADQSTTRKFGGTGLGLSICKKLVASMDGTVQVESVLHKGSRFFFTIPVDVVVPALVHQPPADSQMKKAMIVLGGFASRQSVAGYLSTGGIDVTVVEPDDVANVDLNQCDAIFACSKIIERLPLRAQGRKKPFVVVVTQLGDVSAEDYVSAGLADDLLVKPLGRGEMGQMISRLEQGKPRGMAAITQAGAKRDALPQFASSQILVADDNAVNREVIIEVLRQLGVRTDVAEDGQEAVEMWQAGSYDLVFMDCSMPVMDGYMATTKIRELEQAGNAKRTPVIALTAHIAGDNAEKWRNAGMDEFITKPFTIKTIAERMAMFLSTSEAVAETPVEVAVAPKAEAVDEGEAGVEAPVVREEFPVLDEDVMADLRESGGGSDTLLKRVFQLFENHAPSSLEEIETVANGDDMTALADAAHALKSMCANIGAAKAANACHVVELAARQGAAIDLGGSIAEISASLNEALGAIKQVQFG